MDDGFPEGVERIPRIISGIECVTVENDNFRFHELPDLGDDEGSSRCCLIKTAAKQTIIRML